MSIFDSREFNERLFFPRPDTTPPPLGATDQLIDGLHVRVHDAGLPTLLLFHGNGEVVADYDDQAVQFAAADAIHHRETSCACRIDYSCRHG